MVTQNSTDSVDSILMEGFIVSETEGEWCDVFPLFDVSKVSVGRDRGNDIVVSDSRCSRKHCAFRKTPGGWYVQDLESSNGTYVNGRRIEVMQKLRPGDRIKIGSRKLIYAATMVDPGEILANFSAKSGSGSIQF